MIVKCPNPDHDEFIEDAVRDNPDAVKMKESEDAEPNQTEIEPKPACHKVFSGIKESRYSKWTVEFSRRFGPG